MILLHGHGASAHGIITRQDDGGYRAMLFVRSSDLQQEQSRGPETLGSEGHARDWLAAQAGYHGFKPNEFDVKIEVE